MRLIVAIMIVLSCGLCSHAATNKASAGTLAQKLAERLVVSTNPPPSYSAPLSWNRSLTPWVTDYQVWWGVAPGDYTNHVAVGNTNAFRLTNLVAKVRYFVSVKAYDAIGEESPFSNEIDFTLPQAPVTYVKRWLEVSDTLFGPRTIIWSQTLTNPPGIGFLWLNTSESNTP